MNHTDAVKAVMDYDELMAAHERNNSALSHKQTMKQVVTVEDVQERQRQAINEARWCLAQGWTEKARQALEGI